MTNISKAKALIDTNILVYLLDKDSEFHPTVVKFFESAEKNKIKLTLAHQNVLELIRTLMLDYSLSYKKAEAKALMFVEDEDIKIIHPQTGTLSRFFQLASKVPAKRANVFDLYLVATALDSGVNTIITNDPSHFEGIKGLNVLGVK